MQPSHETSDMRWAEQRVGPERVKGAYSWATMQKFGVRLAFGTDYDVEPISPFRGLYACVTRELPPGGPQGGWQPQEKISLEDCIRAYTSGSPTASLWKGRKAGGRPENSRLYLRKHLTKSSHANSPTPSAAHRGRRRTVYSVQTIFVRDPCTAEADRAPSPNAGPSGVGLYATSLGDLSIWRS